jgi:competence ComEA-like helix-hairpin-helix protein
MYAAMGILVFAWLVVLFAPPAPSDLPPGNGKEIVERACVGCHVLKVVTSKRATHDQWSQTVDLMVSRGADVEDDEIDTLVAYLSKNFPPATKTSRASASHPSRAVNVNSANADQLSQALGLSAKDAAAIVSYRQQKGDFKTLADLTGVPGVDAKKIESNKSRITF